MNDYKRNTFLTRKDDKTGQKRFYLKVDHLYVEVDKEVFYVCFNSYRKMLRQARADYAHGIVSIDAEDYNGSALSQKLDSDDHVQENVYFHYLKEMVELAMADMDEEDQNILKWVLFEEKTEKEIADILGIQKNKLAYRKRKLLAKIRLRIIRYLK